MVRYCVVQPAGPLMPPSRSSRHNDHYHETRNEALQIAPMKSNYQRRLYAARNDVRVLAKDAIVAATGNRYAEVAWTREETSGVPKTVFKWHVEMEGWPAGVTYEAPGHMSSARTLEHVADGLRSGAIWFRRVPVTEVWRRERELGLAHVAARRARSDAGLVRPLRPLGTRSALLRKWTGIHTRETVSEQEDIEAAIWPDDGAAAADVDEIEEWDA